MLCISKKTEYALAALAHMAEKPGQTASAREIARNANLPLALLMNILKILQGHGLLQSTRGVKGGYRVARDLTTVSLHELIAIVECQGPSEEEDECGCLEHAADAIRMADSHGPVQALQFKLVKFLRDVRVADLVLPGRRIDVPIELLNKQDRRIEHAHHVV
jgi:Rrf2 family protein